MNSSCLNAHWSLHIFKTMSDTAPKPIFFWKYLMCTLWKSYWISEISRKFLQIISWNVLCLCSQCPVSKKVRKLNHEQNAHQHETLLWCHHFCGNGFVETRVVFAEKTRQNLRVWRGLYDFLQKIKGCWWHLNRSKHSHRSVLHRYIFFLIFKAIWDWVRAYPFGSFSLWEWFKIQFDTETHQNLYFSEHTWCEICENHIGFRKFRGNFFK